MTEADEWTNGEVFTQVVTAKIAQAMYDLDQLTMTSDALAVTLDELAQHLNIGQITDVIAMCEYMSKTLSVVKNSAIQAGVKLIPKDTKTLEWSDDNGTTKSVELKWRSVRTAVQKDDLLGAVKQTARTVNQETGEVVNDADQLVTTLLKAYRLEPRWTEIKGLGIDPDEFCQVRYEPSIITTTHTTKTGESQ